MNTIHAYTFEAIHKGQYTKKVIENFDHLEKISPGFLSTASFHIGAYDYGVKLHHWKITDVLGTISNIEKDNTNMLNNYGIQILKNSIKAIIVTVCEAEFLPFNYIILHFELDSTKIVLNNSYRMLSALLNPLIDYWLTFDGRFASEYDKSFSLPSFFHIQYDSEKLKPELDKVMKNLQHYSEKINLKKYVENCNELKQYFLLENLDNEYVSMLKIQNDFYLLGNIPHRGSDFATVFSLEPSTFKYTGTNPFFSASPFFGTFPALFLPYLLLVSSIFWLRSSRRKITDYLSQINRLKIEYKTVDYLSSDNEKEFLQIFDLDNNLNFLLSESKELQKMNTIFNNHFLKNPEMIDKSIILEKYDASKKANFERRMKYSYVTVCNLAFQENFQEIEKYIKEIQEDLSFIKKRIEFLQNKKYEKIKSKQNRIMIISAIISGIFAGIVGLDVLLRRILGP